MPLLDAAAGVKPDREVPCPLIPEGSFVVVVHRAIARSIRPIPVGISVEFWRTFQLAFCHASAIAAEL